MAFLVWNNKQDGEDSIAAVNAMYGCPYRSENGYRMDQWDFTIKSNIDEGCGFYKPEERLGMKMDDLMPALVSGFIENNEKPEEFYPESREEELE